jgi:hypothetical protein
MLPERINYAFSCFTGKELQVLYAIDKMTSDGVCYSTMKEISNVSGIQERKVSKLIEYLESLSILVIRKETGKRNCMIMKFDSEAEKKCLIASENISDKKSRKIENMKKEEQPPLNLDTPALNEHPCSKSAPLSNLSTPVQNEHPFLYGTNTGSNVGHNIVSISNTNIKKVYIKDKIDIEENFKKPVNIILKTQSSSINEPKPTSNYLSAKDIDIIKHIFEIYSNFEWSLQKSWKEHYLYKNSLCRNAVKLYNSKLVYEYFNWIYEKSLEFEKREEKKFNLYFASIMSDTWFSEFFNKKIENNLEKAV